MTRILVLDDEPALLRAVAERLRVDDAEVHTCREMEAAEALLHHLPFDAVVTDLEVSELGGLEGMRIVRHVATNFPKTRVIVLSGRVNDEVRQLGRALGAMAVLEKPADWATLLRHVHGTVADTSVLKGTRKDLEPLDEFLATRRIGAALQPIVSLSGGAGPLPVHAVESLARVDGESSLRNPELLFAYASRKERLLETDLKCIDGAIEQFGRLAARPLLFLNTHPRTLSRPEFPARVADRLSSIGLKATSVVFEITEAQTIVNAPAFAESLAALRGLGFGTALDDYGKGYSNLQLLRDLRPQYLKIDGSMIRGAMADPWKRTILASTAQMAVDLGVPTILECIENDQELAVARELRITYGQGYGIAKPGPAEDLARNPRIRVG